ncbi:hypothetical protein M0804_009874 [Polistes exclamans]|nr:hypothetical protein M0804_009874 [Polistes exclamans]
MHKLVHNHHYDHDHHFKETRGRLPTKPTTLILQTIREAIGGEPTRNERSMRTEQNRTETAIGIKPPPSSMSMSMSMSMSSSSSSSSSSELYTYATSTTFRVMNLGWLLRACGKAS